MPKTFPEFPNLFVMDHPLIQHEQVGKFREGFRHGAPLSV